jgi:biopolymer transport protein ExbB
MKQGILLVLAVLLPLASHADHPTDLDYLLHQVQDARQRDQQIRKQREQQFLAEHADRKALLAEVTGKLQQQRARSKQLKAGFEANEQELGELQEHLDQLSGDLGELFGTVRQYAGDFAPLLDESMVSVEHPGRGHWLRVLGESKRLPDITELERFWLLVQQEILESGHVIRHTAEVTGADGITATQTVVRIGVFNALLPNGHYLNYHPDNGRLVEPERQPTGQVVKLAAHYAGATSGLAALALDPTRGVLLELLAETPQLMERIHQGGVIGYLILALGVLGLVVVLLRLTWLAATNRRIQQQLHNLAQPADNNPLGRVLLAARTQPVTGTENLSLQLDEAIMRELPRLTRGEALVKLLAAVAPLLGLLGTVVGMIVTFQSISLFGTGDPKLMADGISQALVTTALGLIVAIPLLFLHSLVSSRSKVLIHILDEQSAGLLASAQEQA